MVTDKAVWWAVVISSTQMLCKKYEREIADLKKELAMRDALSGRAGVSYDSYTEEQRYELRNQLRRFLNAEIESDDLEVSSLRHVREILGQFRELWKSRPADEPQQKARATPAEPAAVRVVRASNYAIHCLRGATEVRLRAVG